MNQLSPGYMGTLKTEFASCPMADSSSKSQGLTLLSFTLSLILEA